jgi:hypothetical protein
MYYSSISRQCLYGDFRIFIYLFNVSKPEKTTKNKNKPELKKKKNPQKTNQTNKTKAIFCDYEVQYINQ